MSSESAVTAAETPAANGHGEAHHSTATFRALMLGSIGVVYGDIGTSPLYALREAVVAASGRRRPRPSGGARRLSLILWALIVVVTLKYVVILLRADNNGEGGTLALMALAQRAVSQERRLDRAARHHQRRAILWRRRDYAGVVGAVGDRRHQARHRGLRALCRAADRAHPGGAVCGSVARHRARRRLLRADHVHLVCRPGGRGGAADLAAPRGAVRSIRSMPSLHDPSRRDRLCHAGRGVSRRDRGRGALCRSRAFRQTADPDRVAVHRAAVAGAELYGAGRARASPIRRRSRTRSS